ncbi:MAG: heme NO-binding protein [Rhodobacteraceae bacterium]|nr:heme NO-binding protein [Paracoccaceae bacterium]
MHGLINGALQGFLCATYGHELWRKVMDELDTGFESFEPMFHYDDALTHALIDTSAKNLGKPRDVLLEDFGTYLVANPRSERVRRLLRFGGVDYADFLHSLDDLPGRARLAVPDLNLPQLELHEHGENGFSLSCTSPNLGFGHVILGVLRALADDYGALAFLEHLGRSGDCDTLSIQLLDSGFSEGREFSLAQKVTEHV